MLLSAARAGSRESDAGANFHVINLLGRSLMLARIGVRRESQTLLLLNVELVEEHEEGCLARQRIRLNPPSP